MRSASPRPDKRWVTESPITRAFEPATSCLSDKSKRVLQIMQLPSHKLFVCKCGSRWFKVAEPEPSADCQELRCDKCGNLYHITRQD